MRVKQAIILLILILSCLTVHTQDNSSVTLFENPHYNFPYQLAEPDKSWKMPAELVEISGLSFIDYQRLACVQDEKGMIFIFNLQAGEIELKVDFGEDADYEGIEIIEKDAWILKSNGTLYKVTDYLKNAEPDVKKYKTALSGKNNAEGLAYDPVNKNLLIACKDDPFVDERNGSGLKAVYSFNLETRLLDLKPFLLISLDTIRHYRNYDAMTRLGVELQALLDPLNGDVTFKPSGIAIQPMTGDVFILGSVGNLLLIESRTGEILAIMELIPKIFPQPEGICFSPDGTLYISNEGHGREGTILKFEPKNK